MLRFLITMVFTLRRTACWAGRGASERGRRAALSPRYDGAGDGCGTQRTPAARGAQPTRARAEEGERAGRSLARRSVAPTATHRSVGIRSGTACTAVPHRVLQPHRPSLTRGHHGPTWGFVSHATPQPPAPGHPSPPPPLTGTVVRHQPPLPKPTLGPTAALCCEGGGVEGGGAASPAPCAHVAPARPPRCHSTPARRGGARGAASVSIKGGGAALRHLLTACWGR